MHMAVDAAGQDIAVGCVECLARLPHIATDLYDLAVLYADIGAEHVGGGYDRTIGNDQIKRHDGFSFD